METGMIGSMRGVSPSLFRSGTNGGKRWLKLEADVGVRWMERTLPRCELIVKPGEGHNLLSSTAVVIEVFDRLVDDLQEGIV